MASAEKFPHQNVLFAGEEKKCTLPNGALSRRAGMGRPSIFSDKYWEAGIETDRWLWIILPAPSWHLPVWSIWATANQRYLNTQASAQNVTSYLEDRAGRRWESAANFPRTSHSPKILATTNPLRSPACPISGKTMSNIIAHAKL